ncbi:hypothetical protein [Engelhardtia mirabilis]|uniref:Uncharacterized protein n=1 Tax=Engelhardtia mirabilis TaxID=2528011 RepID=A0A518BS40_9BACT|nr:hypothetical protein Pla133_49020 [Planctomycetes bacterium Pla133]QDV04106.1 hypothetical protein Pla86_49000 [Planctomycetes bacterium Pla86]
MLRLLLRVLLWPLSARRRAIWTAIVLLGGAGWWQFGDQVLRFLGLGRPPERSVYIVLETPDDLERQQQASPDLLARYGGFDRPGLEAELTRLRGGFTAACDLAFNLVRARGDGERTLFARGGLVPLDPDADPTLITRVVHDPAEARGSDPVALTLTLDRDEFAAIYAQRDELRWLETYVAER